MLDPAQSYAWRQYSLRPSFGTLREWLYSGWIYNTRQETMEEGLPRAGLLEITRSDLELASEQAAANHYATIFAKARSTYVAMDAGTLNQIAAVNDISYFVFEREGRVDLADLEIVFENERYLAIKPSPRASSE